MAGREHYHDSILRKNPDTLMAEPLANVAVSVDKILENGTVDPITPIPYAGRKLNTAATPMQTDEDGEIDFWLDPGDYNVTFSDPLSRIADKTVGFSSTPGAPNGMLRSQLPEYGYGLAAAGDIKLAGKQGDHPGWLACDGRSLSTTGFPGLFDAIGYAFGGSGASFSIPDLRDTAPIGPGNMGTARGDANIILADTALGKRVGDTHFTFNEDYLPAHTHPDTLAIGVTLDDNGGHDHGSITGYMEAGTNNPHSHPPHPTAVAQGQEFVHSGDHTAGGTFGTELIYKRTDHTNAFRGLGGTGATDINHRHPIAAVGNHNHVVHVAKTGTVTANTAAGTAAKTVDIVQPCLAVSHFIKT